MGNCQGSSATSTNTNARADQYKFKVIYFDGRGRGEAVRMILAAGGKEFDDQRIPLGADEWTKLKPKTPFGSLPVIEADGKMISSSNACARFAAKCCDLAGSNYFTQAQVDSVIDTSLDLREAVLECFFPIMDPSSGVTKEQACKNMHDKAGPILKKLDAFLDGNKYFVENKLSAADIQFVASVEGITLMFGEKAVFDKNFPKLSALYERVTKDPKIAAYLSKRPETPW